MNTMSFDNDAIQIAAREERRSGFFDALLSDALADAHLGVAVFSQTNTRTGETIP